MHVMWIDTSKTNEMLDDAKKDVNHMIKKNIEAFSNIATINLTRNREI